MGPFSAASITVGTYPEDAAFDLGNGYLYVPVQAGYVDIINGTTVVKSLTVGSYPFSATYDPTNGYIYVTNEGSSNVSVIDGTALIGTVAVGKSPEFACFDPTNGYIYVPNSSSANVSVINGTGVVGTIAVGRAPTGAAYDTGNKYVYVPNLLSGNVSLINGTSLAGTVAGINPPGAGTSIDGPPIVYDGKNGYVYVVSDQNISVINDTSRIAQISLNSSYGAGPAYDSSNGYVYVPVGGVASNSLAVIDGTIAIAWLSPGWNPGAATYSSAYDLVFVTASPGGIFNNYVSVVNETSIVTDVPAGTLSTWLTYDSVNGYIYVSNSQGTNVTAIFVRGTFPVTFDEVGLPADTNWSVDLTGGSTHASTSGEVEFIRLNGTYSYSIPIVKGEYAASVENGSLMVNGTRVVVSVTFQRLYHVNFTESGLPIGSSWSVTLNGSTLTSGSPQVSFVVPNGSYSYSVGSVGPFAPIPSVGTVPIQGMDSNVLIQFAEMKYLITFAESGLPMGIRWSVALEGGPSNSSLAPSTVTFAEPNGTYVYTVGGLSGWKASNRSGAFSVQGSGVSLSIDWSEVTYKVTFTETGLPNSTGWWVNVTTGPSTFSDTTSLVVIEPNGTYAYGVATTNRTYSSPGGALTVQGTSLSKTAAFEQVTYTVTFNQTGLRAGNTWSIVFHRVTRTGSGSILYSGIVNGTYTFKVNPLQGYEANPDNGIIFLSGQPIWETIHFALVSTGSTNGSTPPSTLLGLPMTEANALLSGMAALLVVIVVGMVFWNRKRNKPREVTIPQSEAPSPNQPGES